MSEIDERELVQRIHQKDAEALARFLELKQGALIGYINRQLGPGLRKNTWTEDIFQEVCWVCIKNLDRACGGTCGWKCRICEQRVVDAYSRFYGAAKRDA
ncbi:MAG: hypothetical protein HUJ26_12140, partial [Planctomycetaceae bacterium]|nr:hypothetical protein [Planctomycetaceae bacterium]